MRACYRYAIGPSGGAGVRPAVLRQSFVFTIPVGIRPGWRMIAFGEYGGSAGASCTPGRKSEKMAIGYENVFAAGFEGLTARLSGIAMNWRE